MSRMMFSATEWSFLPGVSRPLPNGNIAYANIVSAAARAGYDGFWGMEFLPCGDAFAELAAARSCFLAVVKEWP